MRIKACLLILPVLIGNLFGSTTEDAEKLLTLFCDSVLTLQHKGKMGDPLNGAIFCPCTNPVKHGYHTRAAEAIFPLAWIYSRHGRRKYLDGAFDLAEWLISSQTPEGYWMETPNNWWGTTVHQFFALAAAYNILSSQLKLKPELNKKWLIALEKANSFLLLKVQPDQVPLSYLPTAACGLKLYSEIIKSNTSVERAENLVKETLSHVNADQIFVSGKDKSIDIGTDLCQTIPMLALYATITKNSKLLQLVTSLTKNYLIFLWPDGTVDDSWGDRIQRWTLWGSFGTYGPIPAFALLNANTPVFREAAFKNLMLMKSCCHKISPDLPSLLGYGPEPTPQKKKENICIYPTVISGVGLAIALHWGDLSGKIPPGPLLNVKALTKTIPSCQIIHVNLKGIMATISWNSRNVPESYPPRGGVITHLFFSGIGTVQCATPSLYVHPELFQLPIQKGILSLTPRIEFKENDFWYSNLFDSNTQITQSKNNPPKYTFKGTLCDSSGRPSNVKFQLTYRFFPNQLQKSLYISGQKPNQAIVVKEPFVLKSRDWKITTSIRNQATFQTPNGSFMISLDNKLDGIIMETPEEENQAYSPLLPAVKTIPIQIRFVANRANKARWKITRLAKENKQ